MSNGFRASIPHSISDYNHGIEKQKCGKVLCALTIVIERHRDRGNWMHGCASACECAVQVILNGQLFWIESLLSGVFSSSFNTFVWHFAKVNFQISNIMWFIAIEWITHWIKLFLCLSMRYSLTVIGMINYRTPQTNFLLFQMFKTINYSYCTATVFLYYSKTN